jgi:hypothetical protein
LESTRVCIIGVEVNKKKSLDLHYSKNTILALLGEKVPTTE